MSQVCDYPNFNSLRLLSVLGDSAVNFFHVQIHRKDAEKR